ncbi:MAG TPA: glycosyltransferase [Rhodopila sp.]|nr:glycosyltransferase [Rhodopila sp.]
MSSPQPFLVYRDRIGAPSEIGFLRRQYVGFTRLVPVWTGRVLLPGADQVGTHLLRLGGDGPLGPVRRLLFRQFGVAPPIGVPDLAPVVHAQFARGGALALPLARALGMRLIVTLHGGDVSKQKNWRGTVLAGRWPDLVREAARFVCVSAAVADIAAARGAPAEKLTILPIGVEIAPAPPPPTAPDAHLFVGRFVEKKGISVLAAAIRHLRAVGDTTPVTFIGDGPLRPLLEQLARDVPGVTLTGWLRPDDVRARMMSAYALLVPSVVANDGDAEGLPSVIPEAMAQACPVIGSNQGGISEAIRHQETGLLVAPGEPEALAAAMRLMARDPALRKRIASAGFLEASARLNAHVQSKKLEDLLLTA